MRLLLTHPFQPYLQFFALLQSYINLPSFTLRVTFLDIRKIDKENKIFLELKKMSLKTKGTPAQEMESRLKNETADHEVQ